MHNCIESDALMGMCRALSLVERRICSATTIMDDIYIVGAGSIDKMERTMPDVPNYNVAQAFKLSDYLLATAPVDVKEA